MKVQIVCNKCGPLGTGKSQFERNALKARHLEEYHPEDAKALHEAYDALARIQDRVHREYWRRP